MTKFEAYAERVHALREKRRNEEINLQLAIGLKTRTREEVVRALLEELGSEQSVKMRALVAQNA
ncbi:MAG: hypothetical protein E7381_05925 [Clostridiales bacterium]|nr:hypothetical protein [Clostridiales bacterium]